MKRTLTLTASVLALLTLSGCTGVTAETKHESITITPGQTGTFTNGNSTIIVGGDPTDAPVDETTYLSDARADATSSGPVHSASDADLLAAGKAVCDQLTQGVDEEKVQVKLAGTTLTAGGADAIAIVEAATLSLCR
ncbi:DUF732 domain-containing protein [Microbacterium trichothecenolyticum]|uniref:DUF732 domain-containing protein n=1 Tax=Microbacterium trichothecenolyticum TaxID=69370 RepID=A0ABU0TR56_MICTR|nr:DUF732 domain-containing protein [Microbacterium trichothecenolyticum]MDQ1122146.1 hypothetical protein [Microbacterium trichothecenolyticum]